MLENKDTDIYELLLETGKAITSEVELEKLVQQITDIGTKITGAQFGAFFYNVINQHGEEYQLYTISGVPKEAFSKFPMPRNTAIFHPTFAGLNTVRYDDVTKQPHYGLSSPHFGMPRGHLPVKSYLATSVKSAINGEVIGGLFFGHSTPGVFTEKSERLIEGMAAQAAVAMVNAKLFEEKRKTEQSLKEQREQYRSIFNSTNDGMIIFNEAGAVVEANRSAADLLGYSFEELKALTGPDLFEHSSRLFVAILSIIKSGRQYQGIAQIQNRQHQWMNVRLHANHYLFRDVMHILVVIKRIESATEMEEALIKSEAFSQTITNVSPVTLWMTNEQGAVIYLNQTWADIAGGKPEDHYGTGWLNPVLPEDRAAVEKKFTTAFTNKTIYNADFRIRRRDGVIRWCSSYGSPYYQPNGSFGGYAGSVADITERKQAEEELSHQNTLINTITNNTLQALFFMDDRQYCTYMNPAAEQMTGYKLAEIQEKPLHYYIQHTTADGRHFAIEESDIDRALPTRRQINGEATLIRKNSEFFPVAFVASPIIEHGMARGTVIEVREITEEKRLQDIVRNQEKAAMSLLEQKVKERTAELEKINYELMQFTSVASHDLKEPLRKIAYFTVLSKDLASEFRHDRFHKYMDNVIRSANRMSMLIDDLLSYTRLNQVHTAFKPIDLNILLEQIEDDLQLIIAEKKATLNIHPLPTVRGIELQLGQVFQNLISNSLKFAHPDRDPVICISHKKEGDRNLIVYEDNGIGFDNEMAGKIFDLFERLHARHEYEGTGIGLAIVKKIVLQHGGDIVADGKEGKGAIFSISLPA